MEAELKEAATEIVCRAQALLGQERFQSWERTRWRWVLSNLLAEGVIEIGPNLDTGPDPEALADDIIALCGGNAALAERVVTRSRGFA